MSKAKVERANPPFSGSFEFYHAWCKEHRGTLRVAHKNPRGVIVITQGGQRTVFHHDKYGKGEDKYFWGSTMPVDFFAQCALAYHKANPDAYKAFLPTDSAEHYRDEHDRIFGKKDKP